MAAALAATGYGAGGTETSTPRQPSGTEVTRTDAAVGVDKTEAAKDTASGEKEPVLVVYTTRSEALNNAVILESEKDTGTKVGVVVAGTGELLKRAQSKKDNPLGDISWIVDQTTLSFSKELLMEYVSPEDENMLDMFHSTTDYFTPAFADSAAMTINKDLKDGMKTGDSRDLLNPELKDKIAPGGPVDFSSAFQSLLAMPYSVGKDGDSLSDQAWGHVDQLIVNLGGEATNSSSQVYKSIAEGEYMMGLTWEDPAANYAKKGTVVEMVFPREGVVFPGESIQILKGRKHSEDIKKFVDYMLSEKIQNAVDSNPTVRPLREDAKLADYMTSQFETKLSDSYDEDWAVEHKTGITNLFNEHMEISTD